MTDNRIALSIPEAAKRIGIGRSTMQNLIRDGKGPRLIKIGRRSLILVDDLKQWLYTLSK